MRYGQIISAFWNPPSGIEGTSCRNLWTVQKLSLKFMVWEWSQKIQEAQVWYLHFKYGKGKAWKNVHCLASPPKKNKKKTRNRLLHENYYYIEKNKKDNKWIKKLSIMKSWKISFQLFISTKWQQQWRQRRGIKWNGEGHSIVRSRK